MPNSRRQLYCEFTIVASNHSNSLTLMNTMLLSQWKVCESNATSKLSHTQAIQWGGNVLTKYESHTLQYRGLQQLSRSQPRGVAQEVTKGLCLYKLSSDWGRSCVISNQPHFTGLLLPYFMSMLEPNIIVWYYNDHILLTWAEPNVLSAHNNWRRQDPCDCWDSQACCNASSLRPSHCLGDLDAGRQCSYLTAHTCYCINICIRYSSKCNTYCAHYGQVGWCAAYICLIMCPIRYTWMNVILASRSTCIYSYATLCRLLWQQVSRECWEA